MNLVNGCNAYFYHAILLIKYPTKRRGGNRAFTTINKSVGQKHPFTVPQAGAFVVFIKNVPKSTFGNVILHKSYQN